MESQALAGIDPMQPPRAVDAGLEGDIQAHLGRQLRALYDEVASQPVPDRFVKLIEELERRSTSGGKGDA
ncbi:MAG TPA: NepR family anti-sigma factor [Acetobacteraceae bacterium]|nr:NepR family anti-sigma factor [Acetobacteraceae bacterium]